MIYREKYKVELEDIGMHNRISNKRIITIMEDVAAAHSDSVGYGVKEVGQTNCAWVLLDWKIKVVNRPEYNTHIEAFTWSRKSDKLCAYRDFELRDNNGNVCALETSRWLYMNLIRRRPVVLNQQMNEIYDTEEGKMVFDEEICKIDTEIDAGSNDNIKEIIEKTYKVERRDMDINGHMHNVSYIEAAYEVIPEDIYKNHEYSDIRVEYKKEIMENQEIKIRCIVFKNNGCLITMESENKLHAVIKLS